MDSATYRGDRPDALADAILTLLNLARDTAHQFTFGPLRIAELERDGLTITGPDLGHAMTALAAIPGIAQVDH